MPEEIECRSTVGGSIIQVMSGGHDERLVQNSDRRYQGEAWSAECARPAATRQ